MLIKNRKIRRFGRKVFDFIEKYLINPQYGSYKGELELGWSFVITTYSAENNLCLSKCIQSIESMFQGQQDQYEIIIIGRKCKRLSGEKRVQGINFRETGVLTGWITRKENLGIKKSKYDKIVVCHDYIGFNKGWLQGFRKFGEDFDVCVTRVELQDGRRSRDWIVRDYPGIGRALLPYDVSCLKYQYINGAYFICKKEFMMKNLFDERLRACEAEDVEWTKRIADFASIKLNRKSVVKYLKEKPRNDPPYCDEWIYNTKKICEIFNSFDGMDDMIELMEK